MLAEIEGVQQHFGLSASEAVAMLIGYGIPVMTQRGLIGGRFSTPLTRAEMLAQVAEMVAAGTGQ